MLLAEIWANVKVKTINQTYTYTVPEELNFITAGWRVTVPFGRQKIDGFVLNVYEGDPNDFEFELKSIIAAIDDEAWFTEEMMVSAKWLADFYLCPLSQTMTLFMPGDKSRKIIPLFEDIYKLNSKYNADELVSVFPKNATAKIKFIGLFKTKSELTRKDLQDNKISAATVKVFKDMGIVEVDRRRILRDSYSGIRPDKKVIDLTAEQKIAIEEVTKAVQSNQNKGFLLYGVTGSGKTQVYIEITKRVRQIGRRAVILVPEIALTGQIVYEFKRHFKDIIVLHSRLSVDERGDAFQKIRNGEVGVVIGARSALFTPIDNVGLFVLDEEQDYSYKQNEAPYYHARVVAEQFAKFHNAAIVLGSATPSLDTYYRAKSGDLKLLSLPHRVKDNELPEVECVDMREELKHGNKNVLSRSLQTLLQRTIKNHQQAILLLNRRGYSTFVMCRECGEVIKCRDCGMPMVYHRDGMLRCHHCDIEDSPPDICPNCGSRYIKYFGSGTQRLEQALKIALPEAKILRMDRDTTGKKFSHQQMMTMFKNHEYDILFGTQMVAKGHDIDNVTAVGILSADSTLNIPDFRAAEQCFMLITQAAGRAGRAELKGKVVVQAYNPEHEAVIFGCKQDYDGFCEYELPLRKEFFYPPYSRLIKLIFSGKDEQKTKSSAEEFVNAFKQNNSEVMGPTPAIIAKYKDIYRFIVLIKTIKLENVLEFLRQHEINIRNDITIDIDPTSMF